MSYLSGLGGGGGRGEGPLRLRRRLCGRGFGIGRGCGSWMLWSRAGRLPGGVLVLGRLIDWLSWAYSESHCEDWMWNNEGSGVIGAVLVTMRLVQSTTSRTSS